MLELKEKQKKEQILSYWKTLIPANLVFEVLLNTNTHGKVGALTHGELKESGWAYGEIPFADLSGYMKVSEYVKNTWVCFLEETERIGYKSFPFFLVRRIGVTKPTVQLGVGKNTLV